MSAFLSNPALLGLELEPTIAMRRGEQLIFQCAQCGPLAVQTNLAHGPLSNCPACGHGDWWKQQLPVAGLHNATTDTEGNH